MKIIRQTLLEKKPFKHFDYFFSRLRDNVHIFYPILLKLAQIICIVVKINPVKTRKIRPKLWEKGPINIFFFPRFHDKVHIFYQIL